MGLIILIAIGAAAGWFATNVERVWGSQATLLRMATGTVGALALGALLNPGPLLIGISPLALLGGVVGAALLLMVLGLAWARSSR